MSVADTSLLDAETKTYYDLFITVSDGYTTSSNQKVRIDLKDVNEFKPIVRSNQSFLINPFLVQPGDSIAVLLADDKDLTKVYHNWQIQSGDSLKRFALDSLTGLLVLKDTSGLLTLSDSLQVLYVNVNDADYQSDSAKISITFSSAYKNDYPPVISAKQEATLVELSLIHI